MFLLNARSCNGKSLSISQMIVEQNTAVKFIVETWLDESDDAVEKDLCPNEKYDIVTVCRKLRKGGDIAIIYNKELMKVLNITSSNNNENNNNYPYECLELDLSVFNGKNYDIVSAMVVYRPPFSSL